MCRESADVNQDIGDDWNTRVQQITYRYSERDIFNMDETGLFYRAISDKTLTLKGQWCKDGKFANQRLTIALCANLCGEKEQPLVIHTAVHPRCFKNTNISLRVSWHANRKSLDDM